MRLSPFTAAALAFCALAFWVTAEAADVFAAPRKTIKEVLESPVSVDRMVISGVVLRSARSNAYTIFIVQDATGSAYIYGPESPNPPEVPQPGDRVEIEGAHSTNREVSPQLYEAVWRVTGHEKLPEGKLVPMAEAMSLEYDGKLVRVRGRVIDYENFVEYERNVSRIWIRQGDVVTYGNYLGPGFVSAPAKVGQLVELEGVCNVSRVAPNVVRTYSIQLHRMSDVRVLPEPPPWEDPTARRIIFAILAALAAAAAWVFFLRRQVRVRTAQLAVSEDRLRVALDRERELGQLKTNFISTVSHELRTPLNVIVTSSDILARYLDRLPEGERAEHLDSIQSSVKRMAGMVEDVLLLGRFEGGRQKFQPQEIHLTAWCQRFADEMRSATAGRCPIELTMGDFSPIVRADEGVLRHILANLITNAVKYSVAGSTVQMSVAREGNNAVFQIVDQGIGIPAADRTRLFEAFQRGSNAGQVSGTGLGLVVVKRGVELHGGTVEFTSEEGRGTTFTIRLPIFSTEN